MTIVLTCSCGVGLELFPADGKHEAILASCFHDAILYREGKKPCHDIYSGDRILRLKSEHSLRCGVVEEAITATKR